MIEMLNTKTRTEAGCVDLALKAKVSLGEWLKRWGAREQRPPPLKKNKGKGKGKGNWEWHPEPAAAASGPGHGSSWYDTGASASSSSWNGGGWGVWSAWNGWRGGSEWKKEKRDSSPEAGQYDHRGTAPEMKGTGLYAYTVKNRRYEDMEDGDVVSTDSERSDS